MIDIGRMRDRIGLCQPVESFSAAGSARLTYNTGSPTATVWAEVLQPTAKELLRNGANDAQANYTIVCRYRADLKQSWVIVFNGRTLEISSIATLGHKEGLSILAHEQRT